MIVPIIATYIIGFMINMVLEKAVQSFEPTNSTPEGKHNELSDIVRSMNACSYCRGRFTLNDNNTIGSESSYSNPICEEHNLQRYNVTHNVQNKKELISDDMVGYSIFWMFRLPIVISALIGKYTGNLLYQKNLASRVDVLKKTEATDKYLADANIELENYIKRVDKRLDNPTKGI